MHNRAGGHPGLTTAAGALISKGLGLEQPSTAFAATRADKPLGPTALEKILRAGAFRRKAALKLEQRSWKPPLRS